MKSNYLSFLENLRTPENSATVESLIRGYVVCFESSEESPETEVTPLEGIVVDIEKETVENGDYRRVLYTGKHSQLVLMSLKPGEDIGEEVHGEIDQFFRIDGGSGKVVISGVEHALKDGSAFIVPAGAKHNVINTGSEDLKLYSVYSPPNHKDGTVHPSKDAASEEPFDGKVTE